VNGNQLEFFTTEQLWEELSRRFDSAAFLYSTQLASDKQTVRFLWHGDKAAVLGLLCGAMQARDLDLFPDVGEGEAKCR